MTRNGMRYATTDEHNAIWAALTLLANAMDGKALTFADVKDIHDCSGAETGLTVEQVWAMRDGMADATLAVRGMEG